MSFLRSLFRRPEPPPEETGPLFPLVKEAMGDVQAYARSHGGEIRLLSVTQDGDVHIQLFGTCRGCPMSGVTIKLGVEQQLRQLVPGVRKVLLRD
jgi:Fe-S cluster biogenesis protein NfuA